MSTCTWTNRLSDQHRQWITNFTHLRSCKMYLGEWKRHEMGQCTALKLLPCNCSIALVKRQFSPVSPNLHVRSVICKSPHLHLSLLFSPLHLSATSTLFSLSLSLSLLQSILHDASQISGQNVCQVPLSLFMKTTFFSREMLLLISLTLSYWRGRNFCEQIRQLGRKNCFPITHRALASMATVWAL